MSIDKKDKKECCGCNACAEICPKSCITMKHDKYGFLYPEVDESLCIECGACERICPFPASDGELSHPLKAYAAWANDEEAYMRSSSGGAAYVISHSVLSQNGVVYGCAAESLDIRHIRVDILEDLPRLQGSKYVQSDVRGLFSQVRADLKDGRNVVFIGTPCQVAGLRKFIKNIPDNLLLVDLICHGTPSQQMLREHIKGIVGDKKINKISFRKGNSYILDIESNGVKIWDANLWKKPYKDMYLHAFIKGFNSRPCCHQCSFARPERVSDITIGDFWGLGEMELKPKDPETGISVILPNTQKGIDVTEAISSQMTLVERPVSEAVKGNSQLQAPVGKSKDARRFTCLYPRLPFDMAVRAVLLKKLSVYHLKNKLRPFRPVLLPIINVIRR